MKTQIFNALPDGNIDADEIKKWFDNDDITIVYQTAFYDRLDEEHKSIICYYE